MPRRSTSLRDAALRRLQRSNRWLIAGSVALTAVFAEIAANAFPGKTLKPAGASKAGASHNRSAKTSTQPVKPPVQAPTATPEGQASAEEPPSSSESAPSQEPAPAQESAPAPEPSEPAAESPPAGEAAPEPAPAPVEQQAPPVVSGGS